MYHVTPEARRVYRPHGPRRRAVQAFVRLVSIGCATLLWVWHLGDVAAKQPVAQKFGWFFNYMTFDTMTLQLIWFVLALPADLFATVPVWWRKSLDDFASALFGPVVFVTLSFYGVKFLPMGPLYGDNYQVGHPKGQAQPTCYVKDICVPAWVPSGLHAGNTVAAILDLQACIEHRTFSKRAEYIQRRLTLSYVLWLVVCRFFIGRFPYPFMEEMSWPWASCVLVGIFMVSSCEVLFGIGKITHLLLTHRHRQGIGQRASSPVRG